MSLNRLQFIVLGSWFAGLAGVTAVGLAAGRSPSLAEGFAAALLWSIAAAVFLVVFRGAPPRSIAGVLYDAEQAATAPVRRVERRADSER